MNVEQLYEYVNSKEGVEECFPFGEETLVFKVKGKIFLLVALDESPLRFNAKCNPELALELREQFPQNVLPGYHMNKKHWNTIIVDGIIPNNQIKEFINHSYNLVSSKK